jgi:hypothetical protein
MLAPLASKKLLEVIFRVKDWLVYVVFSGETMSMADANMNG